jgi:hypothetical protein
MCPGCEVCCCCCYGCFKRRENASILELNGFSYLAFLAAEELSDSSRICEEPTYCKSSFKLKDIAAGYEGAV